jgi:hypothetical protein
MPSQTLMIINLLEEKHTSDADEDKVLQSTIDHIYSFQGDLVRGE